MRISPVIFASVALFAVATSAAFANGTCDPRFRYCDPPGQASEAEAAKPKEEQASATRDKKEATPAREKRRAKKMQRKRTSVAARRSKKANRRTASAPETPPKQAASAEEPAPVTAALPVQAAADPAEVVIEVSADATPVETPSTAAEVTSAEFAPIPGLELSMAMTPVFREKDRGGWRSACALDQNFNEVLIVSVLDERLKAELYKRGLQILLRQQRS